MYGIPKEELLKDEEILWSGQPVDKLFTAVDWYLVPFSILWGGFAMVWETMAILSGAPILFCIFGIPFVLIGLYLIFGRFFVKSMRKQNTYYAVTNKRVVIYTNFHGENFQAEFIDAIPCINKKATASGIGNIKFGVSPFNAGVYANTWLEFFNGFTTRDVPSFYDIEDVEKVYRLVNDIRNKKLEEE